MGFKVDSSFLKFLTMGSVGARRVVAELRALGFELIELERSTNKIWATKVKRLRLPDLLCIRTGLRVEVRAKSDLKIRMSDAPTNAERAWDAGMRDEDAVALIACMDGPEGPVPADGAAYFFVRDLRASVGESKLGPPKSASEGAERDRTWPATVPARSGFVEAVTAERLVVLMDGDGAPARRQSYNLNGKHTYVAVGDRFVADVSILAGAPRAMADLRPMLANVYRPLDDLFSQNPLDRYAAAKALRFRADIGQAALPGLEQVLRTEQEPRVLLEVGGTALALGSGAGEEQVNRALLNDERVDLSMESIFILGEVANDYCKRQLRAAAAREEWRDDERRQAAIWGLGKLGHKSYADLLPYIADPNENVAFHAIAAFGTDTPQDVIDQLIAYLLGDDARRAASASVALSVIGSPLALGRLVNAAQGNACSDWVIATLGRLPPGMVRAELRGTSLLARLEPLLLLAPGGNWMSSDDTMVNLSFLFKQNL